jgi:hypothetical protein
MSEGSYQLENLMMEPVELVIMDIRSPKNHDKNKDRKGRMKKREHDSTVEKTDQDRNQLKNRINTFISILFMFKIKKN